MKFKLPKPTVLIILDGFGWSEIGCNNAILQAYTPHWNRIWNNYPHTWLECSGATVGLPDRQMGNSEVGHLHIGCGRYLAQDIVRINQAIADQSFFANTALCNAVEHALAFDKALHIVGLLSAGGVHSHQSHIHAMAELAVGKGLKKVYIHAFSDGRDTSPRCAGHSLRAMEDRLAHLGHGKIASLIGRFYAMDRDNRWSRVQKAYNLIALGKAKFQATHAMAALEQAYSRNESDEFIQATRILCRDNRPVQINDGDSVVIMNYRADRVRELTQALTDPAFKGFERDRMPQIGCLVTLTEYHKDFPVRVAYPNNNLGNCLGEIFAKLGLKQLRLAETEKYPHVTFFFNGGREEPFDGETRIMIPSPKVKTYDLKPEMSATEVTDTLVKAIVSGDYDTIICNYANCDMVGHTGMLHATIQAVETIDRSLGRVVEALDKVRGELLITADHGNAEEMIDLHTGQAQTAHTTNLVPLVYLGRPLQLTDGGNLADVAPTMLDIMGIMKPTEMNGRSLINH